MKKQAKLVDTVRQLAAELISNISGLSVEISPGADAGGTGYARVTFTVVKKGLQWTNELQRKIREFFIEKLSNYRVKRISRGDKGSYSLLLQPL